MMMMMMIIMMRTTRQRWVEFKARAQRFDILCSTYIAVMHKLDCLAERTVQWCELHKTKTSLLAPRHQTRTPIQSDSTAYLFAVYADPALLRTVVRDSDCPMYIILPDNDIWWKQPQVSTFLNTILYFHFYILQKYMYQNLNYIRIYLSQVQYRIAIN